MNVVQYLADAVLLIAMLKNNRTLRRETHDIKVFVNKAFIHHRSLSGGNDHE